MEASSLEGYELDLISTRIILWTLQSYFFESAPGFFPKLNKFANNR